MSRPLEKLYMKYLIEKGEGGLPSILKADSREISNPKKQLITFANILLTLAPI